MASARDSPERLVGWVTGSLEIELAPVLLPLILYDRMRATRELWKFALLGMGSFACPISMSEQSGADHRIEGGDPES